VRGQRGNVRKGGWWWWGGGGGVGRALQGETEKEGEEGEEV